MGVFILSECLPGLWRAGIFYEATFYIEMKTGKICIILFLIALVTCMSGCYINSICKTYKTHIINLNN